MKIEKINIDEIKMYENNAKEHPEWQVQGLSEVIKNIGYRSPIIVDENNKILAGHGRYKALKKLGYKQVEVIKHTDLTEEQKIAYSIADNQYTLNTGFDTELLKMEIEKFEDAGFELPLLGFDEIEMSEIMEDEEDVQEYEEEEQSLEERYTEKVDVPQYQITGENPELSELVDKTKYEELLESIEKQDIPEEIKEFLRISATRHIKFNYSLIAEYYAHAPKTVQEEMEKSVLVLIDFDDALKNGYVKFKKGVEELREDEEI